MKPTRDLSLTMQKQLADATGQVNIELLFATPWPDDWKKSDQQIIAELYERWLTESINARGQSVLIDEVNVSGVFPGTNATGNVVFIGYTIESGWNNSSVDVRVGSAWPQVEVFHNEYTVEASHGRRGGRDHTEKIYEGHARDVDINALARVSNSIYEEPVLPTVDDWLANGG